MDTTMQYCGGCEFTDGLVYMSNPPQCKCTFTGKFHYFGDKCAPSNNINNSDNGITYGLLTKLNNDY